MSLLKTLFVPFVSFALIISSGPVFAQNLVDTVPAFYYLEDLGDESFSVRACSTSADDGRSITGLDCPVVATVSVSDLENFLADFSQQAEDRLAQVKARYKKRHSVSFAAIVSGVATAIITVLKYPDAPKVPVRFALGSIVIAMAGGLGMVYTTALLGSENRIYERQQSIEQEIRSGVVGQFPYNREIVLQQFTYFVNHYGVRPGPQDAGT